MFTVGRVTDSNEGNCCSVIVCILIKPSALRRVVEGSEVFGRNTYCGQRRNPLRPAKPYGTRVSGYGAQPLGIYLVR